MIKVADERLMTLTQLAKWLPRRRGNRPVHPSTLHRWRSPGVHGVRLDCIRIGGAWHSSIEALQRFAERLSLEASPTNPPAQTQNGAPATDCKHQEDVERELEERGA